jgi:hypothetical protein
VRERGEHVILPGRADLLLCHWAGREGHAAARVITTAMARRSDLDIVRFAQSEERRPSVTARDLFVAMLAVRKRDTGMTRAESRKMLARLAERFPHDPEITLFDAQEHALAGRWAEASRALQRSGEGGLDTVSLQHHHPRRALGALPEGRIAAARAETDAGEALEGNCGFRMVRELAYPDDPKHAGSEAAELLRTVREADACFARGDHRTAQALLDRPLVWTADLLQSTARLAHAYLGIEPASRIERLRTRIVLGTLLDKLDPSRALLPEREGVFPTLWDAATIAELAARAQAWLDTEGRAS